MHARGRSMVVAALGALWSAGMAMATATTCDEPTWSDLSGGSRPPASDCCAELEQDQELDCDTVAPGLRNGQQNVAVFVLDDHGYCQNGFMAGRCVAPTEDGEATVPPDRCTGSVCSNAPWIACADPQADCPYDGPDLTATCVAANECSGTRPCGSSADCDGGDTCTAGRCGTTSNDCTHGYCRQCTVATQEADCDGTNICVDGLCSPPQSCSIPHSSGPSFDAGHYVCARNLGHCDQSRGYCESTGGACDDPSDCPGSACNMGRCDGTDAPCAADGDCSDHCGEGDSCLRTPQSCYSNDDCPSGNVCTTSSAPLRLADPSCRYRHAGSSEWDFDRTNPPAADGVRTVFTPQIDALAMQGAVFPRARGGGQKCQPGRGVIGMGRVLRHLNGAGDSARYCAESPAAPITHPIACTSSSHCLVCPSGCVTAGECGLSEACSATAGVCDAKAHATAWWMTSDAPDSAAERLAHTIGVGKSDFINHIAQGFDQKIPSGSSGSSDPKEPDVGKFPCDAGLSTPADAANCPAQLRAGGIPAVALASTGNQTLRPVIDAIRTGESGNPYTGGALPQPFYLYYAPHLPHAETNVGLSSNFFFSGLARVSDGSDTIARTAWTDAGFEVLVNELKRTCVCGADESGEPEAQSLYDNTVFITTSDQGFLMAKAKQNNEARDNAHRAAMVISTGEHRADGESFVLDANTQFAGNHDLLPTVLSYVYGDNCAPTGLCDLGKRPCSVNSDCDGTDTCDRDRCVTTKQSCSVDLDCTDGVSKSRWVDAQEKYPLNDSLRPFADQGMSRGYLRTYYGHSGEDMAGVGENAYVYVVPKPTAIGLCETGSISIAGGHRRPCTHDSHCALLTNENPAPKCRLYDPLDPDDEPIPRRCTNYPDILCSDDSDCTKCTSPAQGANGQSCTPGCSQCTSGLADFPATCSGSDTIGCVPPGTCAPLNLKVYRRRVNDKPTITEVFDLDVDPDENINLISAASSFLGPANTNLIRQESQWGSFPPCAGITVTSSLNDVLRCCVEEFFWLEGGSAEGDVWRPRDFNCPAQFQEWSTIWTP